MYVRGARRLMAAALLSALVLPLSACGAAGEDAVPLTSDGREIVTLGVTTPVQTARALAGAFNARSEDYYVEVTEYAYGTTATPELLYTQLTAGTAPDIIAAAPPELGEAEDSGAFLELTPLLDELSPRLVPAVESALRERPELYGLPYEFEIGTFLVHPSQTGGRESLTMEEAEECAAALGEGCTVFGSWMDREQLFIRVMEAAAGEYLDLEAGTCSFEDPGFIGLLELCMGQRAAGSELPETDGRLLMSLTLQGVDMLCVQERNYGDDYAFMGFPADGEDSAKGWLTWSQTLLRVNASGNTEGALEFLNFALGEEAQRLCECFPVLQSELDRRLDEAAEGKNAKGTLTDAGAEKFDTLLNSGLHFGGRPEAVSQIVLEEARAYFGGAITAQEAARRMQERVGLYLAESA